MKITIHKLAMFIVGVGSVFGLASTSAAQTASVDANFSISARAMAAIELPSAAIELRAVGVPEPEVRTAFVAVHEHHLPAPEVRLMLTHSVRHVRVHGVIPDFGNYIEVRLDDGYRGPRLYREIRVAHNPPGPPPHAKAHGYYKVKGKGHGHGRGNAKIDVHVHGPAIPRPPSAHIRVDVRGGPPAPPHHSLRVSGGHKASFGGGHKIKVRGGGGHSVKVRGGGGVKVKGGGRGKH